MHGYDVKSYNNIMDSIVEVNEQDPYTMDYRGCIVMDYVLILMP